MPRVKSLNSLKERLSLPVSDESSATHCLKGGKGSKSKKMEQRERTFKRMA